MEWLAKPCRVRGIWSNSVLRLKMSLGGDKVSPTGYGWRVEGSGN